MNNNLSGMLLTWMLNNLADFKGLLVGLLGLILGAITLNTFVLVCTALSMLTTAGLNIYKWYQLRKEKRKQ